MRAAALPAANEPRSPAPGFRARPAEAKVPVTVTQLRLKPKSKVASPRIRAGIGPKHLVCLGKLHSGPSPRPPWGRRDKNKIKSVLKYSREPNENWVLAVLGEFAPLFRHQVQARHVRLWKTCRMHRMPTWEHKSKAT